MHAIVYQDNDTVIEVTGLKDSIADVFINTATVTCRVLDTLGVELVASFMLLYVASSDGIYQGILPDTEPLTVDQRIRLEILASDGPGKQAEWLVPAIVQSREF